MADTPVQKQDVRPTTVGGVTVESGPLPAAGTATAQPGELSAAGIPGGPFTIHGAQFNQMGNVFVGGKQVTVTAWDQNRIKGILPPDVDLKAEIRVVDGTGKEQKGYFGKKANPVSVTLQLDTAAVGKAVSAAQSNEGGGPGSLPDKSRP